MMPVSLCSVLASQGFHPQTDLQGGKWRIVRFPICQKSWLFTHRRHRHHGITHHFNPVLGVSGTNRTRYRCGFSPRFRIFFYFILFYFWATHEIWSIGAQKVLAPSHARLQLKYTRGSISGDFGHTLEALYQDFGFDLPKTVIPARRLIEENYLEQVRLIFQACS
jgi:hypothetical protein